MCLRAERRGFIQIRNMITEEFSPGLAPGEVRDSTHNPSAVSVLADRRPDAHPLSGTFHNIVLKLVMWFPSGQFVYWDFFSQRQIGLEFINFFFLQENH